MYGSITSAHRVRQVWRNVYSVNGSNWASLQTRVCCFFSVDFSMWPLGDKVEVTPIPHKPALDFLDAYFEKERKSRMVN